MKRTYKLLVQIILLAVAGHTQAQLNPLHSQYYINQYLINPAFAGSAQGLKINGTYLKLWSSFPGSPLIQNVTADYGFSKVGVGLKVNNESSGLQRQTSVVGSYAYHLPLNGGGQQLHFGISFGFMNQRLENQDLYGNPNDVSVGQYNSQKTYLDGDFGIAYTSGHFNIQGAIPNLKNYLKKEVIRLSDVGTFYTAISYQIALSEGAEGMELEPKVAFRGVKGHDNIWDAGARLQIADKQAFIVGMYHSTKSVTAGLGMNFRKKYLVSGTYTTETSALRGYVNGSFELNLGLSLDR